MMQAQGAPWGKLEQPCQWNLGRTLGRGGWMWGMQIDIYWFFCGGKPYDYDIFGINKSYRVCSWYWYLWDLIIRSRRVGMNMERTLLMIGLAKVTITTRPEIKVHKHTNTNTNANTNTNDKDDKRCSWLASPKSQWQPGLECKYKYKYNLYYQMKMLLKYGLFRIARPELVQIEIQMWILSVNMSYTHWNYIKKALWHIKVM